MWGTRTGAIDTGHILRFIPTGVGNTPFLAIQATETGVHPHGCGEHFSESFNEDFADGSSPRVWGTPAGAEARAAGRRFIPTGVGNTLNRVTPPIVDAVHPHGCGEHAEA